MELTEGVHALPLAFERGDREMTLHAAAVETRRGAILVDAGLPGVRDQLRERLSAAGIGLSGVHDLLLTHQDGDHVGGAGDLLTVDADIGVLAHREAVPYVEGDRDPVKGDPDQAPDPVDVDVGLVDGVVFETVAGPMHVVHTPGHAPGHVSLYLPEAKLLLAADAVVAGEDGLAGPNEQFTPDLDRAFESVRTLADLDVERTLCYHGGLVEQGSERLAAIAETRETA
jgi:glyoxylase-like metal-dependent hydrolase (beta-lactamase superfamily II)